MNVTISCDIEDNEIKCNIFKDHEKLGSISTKTFKKEFVYEINGSKLIELLLKSQNND